MIYVKPLVFLINMLLSPSTEKPVNKYPNTDPCGTQDVVEIILSVLISKCFILLSNGDLLTADIASNIS